MAGKILVTILFNLDKTTTELNPNMVFNPGHIGWKWMLSAHPMQGNPRQSLILDSISWIPDSKYWIPIVSGIPESKFQDSRFDE